jgi:predicted permease
MASIIFKQAILMLLLNFVGMLAYRTKIVDKQGGKQFSNFVLEIVTPVLVVNAYAEVEYESRLVVNLLWTFLLAAISYVLAIAVVTLVIRKTLFCDLQQLWLYGNPFGKCPPWYGGRVLCYRFSYGVLLLLLDPRNYDADRGDR